MKKTGLIIVIMLCILFTGCTDSKTKEDIRSDVEFTVVPRDDIPEELLKVVEEKKAEEFEFTYGTGGALYIVKGYGAVQSGGFSIRAEYVKENSKELFFHSTLVGPKAGEPVNRLKTYPYIVVKIEFRDKKVVFE